MSGFMGNEQEFLNELKEYVRISESLMSELVPVVREPAGEVDIDSGHKIKFFEREGSASTITGETSNIARVKVIDSSKRVPYFLYGASAVIPYKDLIWRSAKSDVMGIAKENLNTSIHDKALHNMLYGDGLSADLNLKEGLLTQSGASLEEIDSSKASGEDIVNAVIRAKNISIKEGSRHSFGFRVVFPLSWETKINKFVNTSGTLSARKQLEEDYKIDVRLSEFVDKPILYQVARGGLYYNMLDRIDLSFEGRDTSGNTSIIGSFMSAGLVVANPKQIVYLKDIATEGSGE